MQLLRNQLYEQQIQAQADAQSAERKAQVGSGDRSERIRTYNFPQNRVTDHRIGLTLHALDQVMDGGFEPLFDGLAQEERARRLASLQEDAAS
jgi:peptide chain release factor 1